MANDPSISIGTVFTILGPLVVSIGILLMFIIKGLKGDIDKKRDKETCNAIHEREE